MDTTVQAGNYKLSPDMTGIEIALALQDQFGHDDKGAGKRFIEKIIQLPLELPRINTNNLRQYIFHRVDQALDEADMKLTREEERNFVDIYIRSLEPQVRTAHNPVPLAM